LFDRRYVAAASQAAFFVIRFIALREQGGELANKPVEILIPARLEQQHTAHREQFHQNPYPRSMGMGLDLKGRKKDDSEFPVEVSLSPFQNSEEAFVEACFGGECET